MGSCPGGIANLAIAAGRLGVRTSLAAAFGDDVYGDFCWSTLTEQEGVDLAYSRREDLGPPGPRHHRPRLRRRDPPALVRRAGRGRRG